MKALVRVSRAGVVTHREQIMFKQTLRTALWPALLVAAMPCALAQPQESGGPVRDGIACGGQYECVDSKPMTEG